MIKPNEQPKGNQDFNRQQKFKNKKQRYEQPKYMFRKQRTEQSSYIGRDRSLQNSLNNSLTKQRIYRRTAQLEREGTLSLQKELKKLYDILLLKNLKDKSNQLQMLYHKVQQKEPVNQKNNSKSHKNFYQSTEKYPYQHLMNRVQVGRTDILRQPFNYNDFSTKNNFIDNFVSNIPYQSHQRKNFINLKKVRSDNALFIPNKAVNKKKQLEQTMTKVESTFDKQQKQNKQPKEQKTMSNEQKEKQHKTTNTLLEPLGKSNPVYSEEYQLQFLAMDAIYYDFQRILDTHVHC